MPAYYSSPPRQDKTSRALRRIFFVVSLFACSAATAQVKMPKGYPGKPPWADTATESNIYPVGDAIGVYTAVLDLYFSDGSERPRVIVMHDTAEGRSGGPCPMQCPEAWLHKSKIKESTMLSFAKLSPKRPRIVPFGYRVPIQFLSYEQNNQLRDAGRAGPQINHQGGNIEGQEWETEFVRRYPGAWGFIYLSKVGFDDAHSEALISVHFYCGLVCNSDENIFLRKIDQQWVVVERIPNSTDGLQPFSSMRYRGPSGGSPSESEVLYPPASERPEGEDVAEVYEAVLDSLYSFHGEHPGRVVITDWFPVDAGSYDSLAHIHRIEPSTLARYKFFRGVRAPLYTTLKLRQPVVVLPRDSMMGVERRGKPLEKIAVDNLVMSENTPFWLGFRMQYPGAWGTVGFTRAAFNDSRTQALVFTSHACGQSCRNDDTWLVQRDAGKWRIAERIPRQSDKGWELDSLRYLGADADPRAYRNRRIRGTFVSQAGTPLQGLRFTARINRDSSFMKTDSQGRFELTSLPMMGGIWLGVSCAGQPALANSPGKYSSRPIRVAEMYSHAGLDSTITVRVDFRRCQLGRRAHALASAKPAPQALASGYPDATDAAVYRGLFDALYPSRSQPVVLFPYVHQLWPYEFEAELVRLTKQGVIDSTVAPRLGMLPKDSAWLRPDVSYGRPVFILGAAERSYLEQQAYEFGETGEQRDLSLTGMVKEAYGADKIISLSRISYNRSLTEAIVQYGVAGTEPWSSSETLILRKTTGKWRVIRRHVEKEETAGDMIAGRCEPVDAVASIPRPDQLARFVGEAEITFYIASHGLPIGPHTARFRFAPNDTLHRYYWLPPKGDTRPQMRLHGLQKLARVQALDSAGKVVNNRGEFEVGPEGARIIFAGSPDLPEGVMEFDGPYEEFTILRVNGRQFFGSWHFESGPTYPDKGYFCGRLP